MGESPQQTTLNLGPVGDSAGPRHTCFPGQQFLSAKENAAERQYFPHIEGLRAVAAILVAVYHIYFGRISGGVDVFFVISGFLITLGLFRRIGPDGRLQWADFLAGLGLRLLPAAGFVLLVVLFVSWHVLPEARHYETLREIVAAFLYFENWQLAIQSVDYLDRENVPSPVQHYWAMSAQAQFYLIGLFVVLAACVAGRSAPGGAGRMAARGFGLLFLASFAYSVYQTHFGNQVWAYYDTFARVWEFSIGALLGLLLIRAPNLSIHPALGWLGVALIVACGLIFQVGSVFPGAAALVPTTAAALVLLGGRGQSRLSISSLLGSRMLVSLGGVAYGVYLLHWPALVFYRELAGTDTIGLLPGLCIIAGSVAGAYALNRFIERPFLALRRSPMRKRRRGLAAAGLPVTVVLTVAYSYMIWPATGGGHPEAKGRGAATLDGSASWVHDSAPSEFVPDLATVKRRLPRSYGDGCHLGLGATEPVWCTYGETGDHTRTLAVVGGSHSAHWLPALEPIAERNGWRIVYSTWSVCRFGSGWGDERCRGLVDSSLATLGELKPDMVFTTANAADGASIPGGYLEAWDALSAAGVRVFAVRDNPWMPEDVPDCVGRQEENLDACGGARTDVLAAEFDSSSAGANVHVADLSNYFCNADMCPPVIGGVLVYRDRHHLTVEYAQSLTAVLEEQLQAAMSAARPVEQLELGSAAKVIPGELHCGPVGANGPLARQMALQLRGGEVSGRRGDWQRRQRQFDYWEGRVEGSRMALAGRYRASGSDRLGEVSLSGTYEGGRVRLTGTRGPRNCTFTSSDKS